MSPERPPRFSVVIPTLNRGARLLRAIGSVLAQSALDYEIIVVDDGSDDTEALLLQSFGEQVRYFRGPGTGVAAGRNLGIAHSRGEFVAFLDSDDFWYPRKLERVAEMAARHPEAGLFYSKMDLCDADGRRVRTPPIRIKSDVYPRIVEGNFIFNSTVVVRKSCLDAVGGYDTALSGCEDWELWIRVTRHCQALLIDEALVAYEYLSAGSFTRRYQAWVAAHDEVIAKALREDPSLAGRASRIQSGAAYAKASIYLAAGEEALALEQFRQAVRLNPAHWRARVYSVVLSWATVRRALPRRIKVALRLPEAQS